MFGSKLLGSQTFRLEPFGGSLLRRALLGFGTPRLFRRLLGRRVFGGGGSWLERTQGGDQLGSQLGMTGVVRMNLRRPAGGRRRCGCLIQWLGGEMVHAAIQRSGHGRFVAGMRRRGGGFRRRLRLAGMRLEHHMRHLRFGIVVAHGDDLCRQRIHVRQLRFGRIELTHHVIDCVDRLAKQVYTIGRQRQIGRAQPLEQAFQRRQQLGQQRNVDHRDGTMQRMHCTQQFFANGEFAAAALDRGTNGLQVLRDLAAQDLQQHRIDRRHHRQRDSRCRLHAHVLGGCAVGIGHARFRHGLHGLIEPRDTPANHATHRFGRSRGVILHPRRLTGRHLLGSLHDGAEGGRRLTVALERRKQLRQRVDGVPHHGLHAFVRLDRVVQHPVEHVFHFPRELAEHAGPDQAAGTLQRMERAADADQR